LPTDARGVKFADAEGRVDWEDGPKIGAVTLPVAIAARATFLDFAFADAVASADGTILAVNPFKLCLAV
jgi:hypothetical protein